MNLKKYIGIVYKDITMDENTFKTFVNNLYIFTEEDKKILREMNIHNIDNEEYYK